MHRDSLFPLLLHNFIDKKDVRNVRQCNKLTNIQWRKTFLELETFWFPFMKETPQYICKGAKKLKMVNENVSIPSLPLTLSHFTMSFLNNQPIEKEVLPASLLHFTMGVCFNQPIEKEVLPQKLIAIEK